MKSWLAGSIGCSLVMLTCAAELGELLPGYCAVRQFPPDGRIKTKCRGGPIICGDNPCSRIEKDDEQNTDNCKVCTMAQLPHPVGCRETIPQPVITIRIKKFNGSCVYNGNIYRCECQNIESDPVVSTESCRNAPGDGPPAGADCLTDGGEWYPVGP
jgi:hypothetical protein